MTQLNFISKTLYSLKRRYGLPVTICKMSSSIVDRETGARTRVIQKTAIKRALVLDSNNFTDFMKLLTTSEFKMGGYFDVSIRNFIIDRKDLNPDFEIKMDDWILYNDRKYEVQTVDEFENKRGYIVKGKETENARYTL